jgi:hypothetical protein
MGKAKKYQRGQAQAKERWTDTGWTKKTFATHESSLGSEEKSRLEKRIPICM